MLEKTICSDFTDAEESQINQIVIPEFIEEAMKHTERLLGVIAKRDVKLLEKLLFNYKKTLNEMNIYSEKSKFLEQFTFDFAKYDLLNKYPEYIPLFENATLFFLNFTNYENQLSEEHKIDALMFDVIRGGFYPLYYLAYSLIDIVSRDVTLEIAKEFIDLYFESKQNDVSKFETVEEYAKSIYNGVCPKNQNYTLMVKDGKFYLKVTRCIEAEVFSELPDLELANLLECYGDFSRLPYINPNFVLTRTKTLVDGHPFCDFVFYDKRIVKDFKHPNGEFWENF